MKRVARVGKRVDWGGGESNGRGERGVDVRKGCMRIWRIGDQKLLSVRGRLYSWR